MVDIIIRTCKKNSFLLDIGCNGSLILPMLVRPGFCPNHQRCGVLMCIIFDFAASASFHMKPFGSCILVSCSSPVTGFLQLSICTFMTSGIEKLLFFPFILILISTNCGSSEYYIMPANNAKGLSPFA